MKRTLPIFIVLVIGFLILQDLSIVHALGNGGDSCPAGVGEINIYVTVFHMVFEDFPDAQIDARKQDIRDLFTKMEDLVYHKNHNGDQLTNACARFILPLNNIHIVKIPYNLADSCLDRTFTGIQRLPSHPQQMVITNLNAFLSLVQKLSIELPSPNPFKDIVIEARSQRRRDLVMVMLEHLVSPDYINGGIAVGHTRPDIDTESTPQLRPLAFVALFPTEKEHYAGCVPGSAGQTLQGIPQNIIDISVPHEIVHVAYNKAGYKPKSFNPHTYNPPISGSSTPLPAENIMRANSKYLTQDQTVVIRKGFADPNTPTPVGPATRTGSQTTPTGGSGTGPGTNPTTPPRTGTGIPGSGGGNGCRWNTDITPPSCTGQCSGSTECMAIGSESCFCCPTDIRCYPCRNNGECNDDNSETIDECVFGSNVGPATCPANCPGSTCKHRPTTGH